MVKVKNNLVDKKFGMLTVLKQTDDYICPNGSREAMWLCRCDCGESTNVLGRSLRRGFTRSCGCLRNNVSKINGEATIENLCNMKFGRLTVKERADNIKGRVSWLCMCDCGQETIAKASDLKSGKKKSCGCLNQEKRSQRGKDKIVDLTGMRFGKLVVLNRIENRNNTTMWHCICDCGNEIDVIGNNLRRHTSTSCGCYAKENTSKLFLADLSGEKFGDLIVIDREGVIGSQHKVMWRCRCKCGNICTIHSQKLRNGSAICCPDCSNNLSKGANKIAAYLNEHHLNYSIEHRFSDCVYKLPLPFDFFIPSKNIAIEYDGEQHFRPVNFGGMNNKDAMQEFKLIQKRDEIKDKYCQTNGIQLIRIPYTQFDSIETILNQQLA